MIEVNFTPDESFGLEQDVTIRSLQYQVPIFDLLIPDLSASFSESRFYFIFSELDQDRNSQHLISYKKPHQILRKIKSKGLTVAVAKGCSEEEKEEPTPFRICLLGTTWFGD